MDYVAPSPMPMNPDQRIYWLFSAIFIKDVLNREISSLPNFNGDAVVHVSSQKWVRSLWRICRRY